MALGESLAVMAMNERKENLIRILYPRRCPVCGEIVKGRTICRECVRKLRFIREPFCKKCGKPLMIAEEEFCPDCMKTVHHYDCGRAVFLYEDKIKKAIYGYKFQNKREYVDFFAEVVEKVLRNVIFSWNPDAVHSVPMHPKKKRKRGYNQSELLAREISKRLGLDFYRDLLIKVKDTDAQKELNYSDRKKNLKNAFKMNRFDVKLKVVLLIDDVYTTGSTMDELARTLKNNGVEKVFFICMCIGEGRF